MDHTYDSFRASSTLAGVASDAGREARAQAEALATQARAARDRAASAAAAANSQTQAIAAQKTRLIHQLARLQHVSVALAEQRQAGIEQAARAAAQQAAEQAAQQAAAQQAAAAAGRPAGRPAGAEQAAAADPLRRSRLGPDRHPPDQRPDAGAHGAHHPLGNPRRSSSSSSGVGRRCRHRLRPLADRRPLRVGRGRTRLVGLLRADHGRLARRRHLAAALLGGAVHPVHAGSPRASCGPATSSSGARRAPRPRSTTSRSTSGTG